MQKNLVTYEANISKDSLEDAFEQLWEILVSFLDYLSHDKIEFIRLAYEYMFEKHGEQKRKSGDFYVTHTVNTAITLAEMEFNKQTLIAALLHDVPEDTFKKPEDGIKEIEKEFGAEIAFLVSGITKLSVIKYFGESKQIENFQRLFVAMSKDLRVIFIKLADRLHNLRTLKSLRPEKALRIALESIEIYAPIADRLGVGFLRSNIENAAFPFAYPNEYKYYLSIPKLSFDRRNKQLSKLIQKTKSILDNQEMSYHKVSGRVKNYYSIHKKLTREKKEIDNIYDLIALRVIVNSIPDCYRILSVIHRQFEIVDQKTKDYIQNPKENGYQSIHTTVYDSHLGTTFEFQIRTQQMHEYAEFGVAAHWYYKQNLSGKKPEQFLSKKNLQWIKSLIDLNKKNLDESGYLKNIRLNVYPDRIFVLTPKNDVVDLPSGATPLDFAYKIHDFIGSHAVMARVNGKVTKLNEELKNGDMVEIVTSKNQHPNLEWLNWVKNNSSAKKIRAFLRQVGENFVIK